MHALPSDEELDDHLAAAVQAVGELLYVKPFLSHSRMMSWTTTWLQAEGELHVFSRSVVWSTSGPPRVESMLNILGMPLRAGLF